MVEKRCLTSYITKLFLLRLMRKILILLTMLMGCASMMAQSAEQLYREGKALYDAKKYAEALPKLKAAADKGHKKAQYRMGRAFDKGNGVAEDNVRAFQWYQKAAAQGYHKGQYQLGRCYKKGKGVAEDDEKAFQLFQKAAAQDNADAELALARHYIKKGDKVKAKQWCLRAVRHEKDGKRILQELRLDSANGDEKSKMLLGLIGK